MEKAIKDLVKEIANKHAQSEILNRIINKIREKNQNLIMPTEEEIRTIEQSVRTEIEEAYRFAH